MRRESAKGLEKLDESEDDLGMVEWFVGDMGLMERFDEMGRRGSGGEEGNGRGCRRSCRTGRMGEGKEVRRVVVSKIVDASGMVMSSERR